MILLNQVNLNLNLKWESKEKIYIYALTMLKSKTNDQTACYSVNHMILSKEKHNISFNNLNDYLITDINAYFIQTITAQHLIKKTTFF